MKGSLIIISFFVLGIILALNNLLPNSLIENDFSVYALNILMFLVGFSIASDKESLNVLRKINFKIFLVPMCVIFGSIIGAAIASLFIPTISAQDSMAVGAGFGYYSLSSIFITEIRGETLGVVALISNILRELITLVATPLIAKYFGKIAPIVTGGATSMDTTLPIIMKYSGKDYAVISIFSGIVLTILVPFIVTFILEF